MAMAPLIDALPYFWDGLLRTLSLTLFALMIATTLGIVMAFLRAYNIIPFSYFVYLYEKVFRGIPLLVIFLLVWLGLPQIGINLDSFEAAVVGLSIRSTAYQSQIFRGAINSIPRGQTEASKSIGLSRLQSIRYIVLPQILRLSIPGWSNEFTIVLKDTSIAVAIGVAELMRQGRYFYSNNPDLALQTFILIAVIYFVIVISVNRGLGFLERRYSIAGYETEIER